MPVPFKYQNAALINKCHRFDKIACLAGYVCDRAFIKPQTAEHAYFYRFFCGNFIDHGRTVFNNRRVGQSQFVPAIAVYPVSVRTGGAIESSFISRDKSVSDSGKKFFFCPSASLDSDSIAVIISVSSSFDTRS